MFQFNLNPILIVGAFPKKQVYGGIYSSCKLIINSNQFSEFKIIPFDSSQISNPPPTFFTRFFLAAIRIIKFLYLLVTKNPKLALIFCSDGASAIEKGFMTLLCKSLRIKVLIFPRAGKLIEQTKKSNLFRKLIIFLFKKADVFLAQAENWNQFAKNQLKIPNKKIKIINNWTATDDLLNIGANKNYPKFSNITKFLFVGWIEKEKGIFEILESIKILNNKKYKFTFNFVGNGKLMKTTKDFIAKNKLEDFITLKGWKTNNQLNEYYKSADVFILPSWAEGMPNALIEALSCGLASITTNVGMIPNFLKDNHNALLVNPKSTEELTIAMEKLILDKNLQLKLSTNGYKVANKYFSTRKGLKSLSELIKNEITNE